MGHFYAKFSDPSCSGFYRYRAENQTDTQTNGGKKNLTLTAVGLDTA